MIILHCWLRYATYTNTACAVATTTTTTTTSMCDTLAIESSILAVSRMEVSDLQRLDQSFQCRQLISHQCMLCVEADLFVFVSERMNE